MMNDSSAKKDVPVGPLSDEQAASSSSPHPSAGEPPEEPEQQPEQQQINNSKGAVKIDLDKLPPPHEKKEKTTRPKWKKLHALRNLFLFFRSVQLLQLQDAEYSPNNNNADAHRRDLHWIEFAIVLFVEIWMETFSVLLIVFSNKNTAYLVFVATTAVRVLIFIYIMLRLLPLPPSPIEMQAVAEGLVPPVSLVISRDDQALQEIRVQQLLKVTTGGSSSIAAITAGAGTVAVACVIAFDVVTPTSMDFLRRKLGPGVVAQQHPMQLIRRGSRKTRMRRFMFRLLSITTNLFPLDSLAILAILVVYVYIILIYRKDKPPQGSGFSLVSWTFPSMVCYALLLFFRNAYLRYLFAYFRWTHLRFILFKITAAYGVMSYMTLGTITFLNSSYHPENNQDIFSYNRDLFLLFVFSALSYVLQIFFNAHQLERKFLRYRLFQMTMLMNQTQQQQQQQQQKQQQQGNASSSSSRTARNGSSSTAPQASTHNNDHQFFAGRRRKATHLMLLRHRLICYTRRKQQQQQQQQAQHGKARTNSAERTSAQQHEQQQQQQQQEQRSLTTTTSSSTA